MQELLNLDLSLFIFLNQKLVNPFFDILMPFITNLNNWRIPILLIWLLLIIKGGRKGRVVALLLIPLLVLSDQISSSLIKPWVGRIRPCHTLQQVRLLVGCGGKLSFPSSHATNISAVAFLFSFFYRRGTAGFILIAVMIGFSRSYVGVHYPGDVLFGFILGSSLGMLIIFIYLRFSQRYPALHFSPPSIQPAVPADLQDPSRREKSHL